MTENRKSKPGLHRASPEEIPPFKDAIYPYRHPDKLALIKTVRGGNDLKWDAWKATVEMGSRSSFDHILDFFVNLPSLEQDLTDESITRE